MYKEFVFYYFHEEYIRVRNKQFIRESFCGSRDVFSLLKFITHEYRHSLNNSIKFDRVSGNVEHFKYFRLITGGEFTKCKFSAEICNKNVID